jgi:carboxypeptidase T
MKRILSALGVFFILSGISVLSLESASRTLERGSVPTPPSVERPVVAQILFANLRDLERLAGELDVWEVHHQEGYLVALLHSNQYEALLQAGYQVEIDEAKTALLNQPLQTLPNQTAGIPGYPCYRTVEETYADLSQLAADHPDLAAWVDIGDSWDKVTSGGPTGYDIHVLVLTNDAVPGPKPKFFLMAAIHARELTTAELAARFAEHLVVNHGTDPDVTWLLDYSEVHIVPIANPDGRKQAEAGEYWRKNTDNDDGCTPFPYYGTDLNRNSSFHWGGAATHPCFENYQGPSAASEPETQAIQNYATSIFPDQRDLGDDAPAPDDAVGIFISLHSYGQLVLFPYGFGPTPAPNHTQLESLGRKFGYFNGYQVCQSGEPGCLYATSGATDDWAYGELGLAAYTFELGTTFFQNCFTFENTFISKNLKALLYAFKSARRPYQTPTGPDSLDVAVMPATAVVGAPVTLTAAADDTRYDSHGWGNEPVQNIAAARYTVDAPAWITGVISYAMTTVDGAFDASSESIQAVVDTTGWPLGHHTLFVESQDADGNWGVPSAVFLWVVLSPDSAIAGTVREKDSDFPIEGATTRLSGNALVEEQLTDSEGLYAFSVYSGTYTLTATASAYFSTVLTQVVASSETTTTQDIVLWPHHRHYLPFIVKNAEP